MTIFNRVTVLTSLRRMFYIVTPNETSHRNVNDVPKFIDESSEFFFLFLFLEVAISILKKDGKVRLNDSITSVSAGLFSRIPGILVRSLTLIAYEWVYRNFLVYNLPWDSPITWWLCFLLVDMGYYWFHRMAHEVNFMWAAHQVHHSSEDYNLSTALRQSVLQQYTSWVFYLPLAFFIPPSVFMVHHELNVLYQFWIHTQYIKSLGPLEYILNTPSHHRVHHGRNPYCIDKNYAGTLIIWDRMFGTFQAEREKVAYGLTHPLNTFEAVSVQFGYVWYMMKRIWELPGVENKLSFIICGPGWQPGKLRLGNIEDIPQVEQPVKYYSPRLPLWLNVYVLLHFTIIIISYQLLMAHKLGFSQASVLVYLTLVIFSLSCFGHLLDQQNSSLRWEFFRCLLVVAADTILAADGFNGGMSSYFILSLRVFFTLSALLCGVLMLRRGKPIEKVN